MLCRGRLAELLLFVSWGRTPPACGLHRHKRLLLHEPMGRGALLTWQRAGSLVAQWLPCIFLARGADGLITVHPAHLVNQILVRAPLDPRPVGPRAAAGPAANRFTLHVGVTPVCENHLPQVNHLFGVILHSHKHLQSRWCVLDELNDSAPYPVSERVGLDLDAFLPVDLEKLLVCLRALPALRDGRELGLELPLGGHGHPRQRSGVVLVLAQEALDELAYCGSPLRVLRWPQLLVVEDILAEPAPELLARKAKADKEKAGTTDIGVFHVVEETLELAPIDTHGKEAVDATEERRWSGVAVRHVGLNVVRELVHLIDELIEVL
mmetsp:Transcript_124859/g.266457  ORF Transcript_124859/g.266457 Transcript_124859/m.266457 type:complete len:323 (+) Transcript_124859:159-1127(+)